MQSWFISSARGLPGLCLTSGLAHKVPRWAMPARRAVRPVPLTGRAPASVLGWELRPGLWALSPDPTIHPGFSFHSKMWPNVRDWAGRAWAPLKDTCQLAILVFILGFLLRYRKKPGLTFLFSSKSCLVDSALQIPPLRCFNNSCFKKRTFHCPASKWRWVMGSRNY